MVFRATPPPDPDPAGIPLEPEDPESQGSVTLDYTTSTLADVDGVLLSGESHDGLESRMSSEDEDDALVMQIQDWRTLSPDDPKGDLLQARVTSGIVRKMDALISRTRGEIWQTRSDFMREAVWCYTRSVVQALQTQDPTLLTLITEAELAGRAHFHNTRRHRVEQAMIDMANYLTDLVNLDDHEEAYRTLLEIAVRMRKISIPAWKKQWLLAFNSLPILRVVVRLLDMNGWDIPVEFFPAAGKNPMSIKLPPMPPTPAPPSPGVVT